MVFVSSQILGAQGLVYRFDRLTGLRSADSTSFKTTNLGAKGTSQSDIYTVVFNKTALKSY